MFVHAAMTWRWRCLSIAAKQVCEAKTCPTSCKTVSNVAHSVCVTSLPILSPHSCRVTTRHAATRAVGTWPPLLVSRGRTQALARESRQRHRPRLGSTRTSPQARWRASTASTWWYGAAHLQVKGDREFDKTHFVNNVTESWTATGFP